MNHQNLNYVNTFNDLTLSILMQLNIPEGSELVSALGYPNTYTNRAAIKRWVIDHYECYSDLERCEVLYSMCKNIQMQIHEHFGVDCLTMQ